MKSTGFRFQNSTNSTNHEQGLKLALMSSINVAVLRPLKVGWPGSHAEMYMESPLESQPVASGCQWRGGIFCGWFIYTLLNSHRPWKKPPCWWYLPGKDRDLPEKLAIFETRVTLFSKVNHHFGYLSVSFSRVFHTLGYSLNLTSQDAGELPPGFWYF